MKMVYQSSWYQLLKRFGVDDMQQDVLLIPRKYVGEAKPSGAAI